MAELSWNSRLCLLLKMGEYWTFFLNHDHLLPALAKYVCVSLVRHETCRMYLLRPVLSLQMTKAAEMHPRTRSRYPESMSLIMAASSESSAAAPPALAAIPPAAP